MDGFHVKHVGLIGDEGIRVLGALLNAMETLGKLPTQITAIRIALIDKPSGRQQAHRPLPGRVQDVAALQTPNSGYLEGTQRPGIYRCGKGPQCH